MKNHKTKILIIGLVMFVSSLCMMACGGLSRMSQEDAYNVGYGVGTLIRNL